MKHRRWLLLTGLALLTLDAPAPRRSLTADPATRARAATGYGRLPLRFEANHGQFDQRAQFVARGPGYGLFLAREGATLALAHGKKPSESRLISMRVVGGRAVEPLPADRLPGHSNY